MLQDNDELAVRQRLAKRVLVCGDRHWERWSIIDQELDKCICMSTVIHGAAPGADTIAGVLAKERGLEVLRFPAKWSTYGRAAGPVRNREMIREGKPDFILAFHAALSQSKGTKDIISVATKVNIPVKLVTGEEEEVG